MKDIDIVYCKNCKHFIKQIINKDSTFYCCNRKKYVVDIYDKPELYCNKRCYESKRLNNKDAKTAK